MLLAGFLGLTAALAGALAGGALLDLDVAIRDWCLSNRWRPLYLLARQLNHLGSANLMAAVCLTLAVPLAIRRRAVTPVLPVLLAFAMSYLLIGPIKLFADRAAPAHEAHDAVQLFAHAEGLSYPSGHVVNAFIWYQVLVLLLDAWLPAETPVRVRRALRVAPPIIVSLTVSYLTFHWFTDTVAGVLLGLLLDRLMRRVRGRLPSLPRWKVRARMDTSRSGR